MVDTKKYRPGIDFIIIIFYRPGYAQLLTASIEKYVKNIPYTVHVINNGINEGPGNGYDELCDIFKDNDSVMIHKGLEQPIDSNIGNESNHICKIDGRGVSIGSWAQAEAMTIGVKNSDREYICYLDADAIFLNEWVDDILPLMEDNVFVSDKWRSDLGTHCCQFTIVKRDFVENTYMYEKDDLYPNIHFKDTAGMLGHYVVEKNAPHVILKNSYNNRSLKNKHLLRVNHGEQAWIGETPIFYHYGRGSARADTLYLDWVKATVEYLDLDYDSIKI